MDYQLKEGTQSNYQVSITLAQDELLNYKEAALKQFQKDTEIDGFRPGHAPLSMVEQRVQPEYLKVAMYEEALHAVTEKMLQEHPDKKFIGQMYNLHIDDEKKDPVTISFLLDVYPDTKPKNETWKKIQAPALKVDVADDEVDQTLFNLKKQYANYKEATTVGKESVFKVALQFVDATGKEVDTGKLYLGKEDIDEFPQLASYFMGKVAKETVSLPYDEKTLPPTMHTKKEGAQAKKINATIDDIKDMELPEFTAENLKKFFGNEEVKSEAELREKIKGLIATQKEESVLMQTIDTYLQDVSKSFTFRVPKTLIDEEMKTRIKSLQERMGGEEGLKKYFEQIGEEATKKLQEDISKAASSSLEKFLILREVIENLDIKDVNREQHLDVEKKLYEKISK